MPDDMESLQRRVAALESALARAAVELERVGTKQRRWVRCNRLTMGALVTGMTVALLGAARYGLPTATQQPQPLTVRAPFTVVDDAGREIVLVSTEKGARGLAVYTNERQQVVFLGRDENNFAGVGVWNKAGNPVATLGDRPGAQGVNTGLIVYNAAALPVATVTTSSDEGGLLAAADQNLENQAQLKVKDDAAGFVLYKAGKPTVELGRFAKGNAALKITSGSQVVAGIGEAIDGSGGSLILSDASGDTRIQAANQTGQGGQVIVYGTAGGEAGIATKGNVGSAFAGRPDEPVAVLGQSETTAGAGHLALAAPGGGAAVQAGYQGNIGLVVTYAQGKPAGILSPGLKIPGFTAGANW